MNPNPTLKILFLFTLICMPLVSFAIDSIVYSRCMRTTGSIDITGNVTVNGVTNTQTRTNMRGLDIYDVLPDVSHFFGGFSAPCDLIYRNASGNETVLYNCSTAFGTPTNGSQSCAALDPAISFDGQTVVFSVFEGTLVTKSRHINARVINPNADSANAAFVEFPNLYLNTTGAHLHKVDIATGAITSMPFVSGIYDSGPAYLTDNRIAFTSTRDGNTHTSVWRMGSSGKGTRIWAMDLFPFGSNLDLSSHHSLSQEQHPFLLKNGQLAYSSWQIFGGLPFRHTNGSPGFFTTLANLFHIYTQAPDGAENFALYGQHSGDHQNSSFGEDHNAAHFIGQTSDSRVWFADYYRANNNGLGVLVGVMQEPAGQEGIHPNDATNRGDIYVPRDVINFASWATNGDDMARFMPLLGNGSTPAPNPNYPDHSLPFAGKVGHPAGLPNNKLVLSWGKGPCTTVMGNGIFSHLGLTTPPLTSGSGQGTAINLMASLIEQLGIADSPGCDIGIYKATSIPNQHPNDLELIVDSKNWHEIMAKAAVPYSAIHGVTHPVFIPSADTLTQHGLLTTGTPFGLLGAASITDRETHPRDGITFVGEHQFNNQGTDTIDYVDDDLCGVRILGVMPNRSSNSWRDTANIAGERVAILGEFSVLNKDSNGNRIIDPSGNLDTSFLVRFPANTPYLMQGIDCDGRTLNTDQTWQQLRPGEKKTCGGCHVHSQPTRIEFPQSFAATNNYTIPKLGEGTVPLLAGLNGNNVNTVNGVATGDTAGTPTYGLQVVYDRDIQPIFDNHCVSCHSGASAAAGLNLDRPTIPPAFNTGFSFDPTTTWGCLVRDLVQNCVPANKKVVTNVGNGFTLRRPQLTKYIRALNSRGSLLYWKAANQRTDNKLDSDDSTDIDFGADHPTSITPYELGLLSRWIDIGSAGGQLELLDTQKPTLHLAATVNNNEVTELKVGTVDLGSGINTNSLVVCVLDINDNCISNLAGNANSEGVVSIALSTSLNNPSTKIFASVEDLTGNVTEVTRNISWFLAAPPTDLIFKTGFE